MLIPKTQKAARLRMEFRQLREENLPLAALLQDLADFVALEFDQPVIITQIYRTEQEQGRLYDPADSPKTRRTSPHTRWEAVDIRDRIYTDAQKRAIIRFLKTHYDATNQFRRLPGGAKTCWLHPLRGGVNHFHVQYRGPLVYVVSHGAVIRERPALNARQTTLALSLPGAAG